jgi:FKBP-type peptidyl-prolyl cis-trans isomerase 2
VRRWARRHFPKDHPLPLGQWVRVLDNRGRRRPVRILEVLGKTVVVDTNHRGAGQALELEVELVGIQPAGVVDLSPDSPSEKPS